MFYHVFKEDFDKGIEKLLLTLEQLVSTLTAYYIYFLSSPGSALSIGTNYVLETCVCQSVFSKKGTSMQFSKMQRERVVEYSTVFVKFRLLWLFGAQKKFQSQNQKSAAEEL